MTADNCVIQTDDFCRKKSQKATYLPCESSLHVTEADKVVIGLAAKIEEDRATRGKAIYALTVTYKQSRNYALTPDQAYYYLRRFHRRLLVLLANSNNISRKWFRRIQPTIHSFVDMPHSKRKASKVLPKSLDTSSLHHHTIVVADQSHVGKLNALQDEETAKAFVRSCAEKSSVCTREKSTWTVKTIKVEKIDTCASLIGWINYSSTYALRASGALDERDHSGKRQQRTIPSRLNNLESLYHILPISDSEHHNNKKRQGETAMKNTSNDNAPASAKYDYAQRIDVNASVVAKRMQYLSVRRVASAWGLGSECVPDAAFDGDRVSITDVCTREKFVRNIADFLIESKQCEPREAERAALRLALYAENPDRGYETRWATQ
jgi:hypothetical protein